MSLASQSFSQLKLDQMSRSFGAFNALNAIDLTIGKGEFIALLGPSGCGKSTALNCIAGLLGTTGGGIWIDDKRIDQLKPEDRGFGMVFQNYALFPHMSVLDNVGFGLKMRGLPKEDIRARSEAALAMVRLQGQGEKLPGQLSGGQQQRVAIARAIVIEPPLVLMDEPLSNLDAKLRLEMRAEIRRIHNHLGATTIYVTHDQDEALSLADRIVVLRDGAIRQVGAPHELYESPAYLDVAEFMGFRNRLTGRVVAKEGDRVVIDAAGARLVGRAMDPLALGDTATLAARGEDVEESPLSAQATDSASASGVASAVEATIEATVEAIEYRGREYVGTAVAQGGAELVFHARRPLQPGARICLRIDPERALAYAGDRGDR